MSSISLDISARIDGESSTLLATLAKAAADLGVAYLVVGATARDIVLHHGYGASIDRATTDVDFGVQVSNWREFEQLTQHLVAQGFRATAAPHRLLSPHGGAIDIVPFGPFANSNTEIAWPPSGATVMNVLGFQEACDHADIIRIQTAPNIDIPVATPAGMALLKIVAWLDRPGNLRSKDAKDLQYLLNNYQRIPTVSDKLYATQAVLEDYDWDLNLAAAHQLGNDARQTASLACYEFIDGLLSNSHPKLSTDHLIEDMCKNTDREFERNRALLNAFSNGFTAVRH